MVKKVDLKDAEFVDAGNGTAEVFVNEKDVVQQEVVSSGYLPNIHNMVRYISRKGNDTPDGEKSVWTVDAEVDVWLQQGYKVKNTHYIGETPEGFGMIYVLVRE